MTLRHSNAGWDCDVQDCGRPALVRGWCRMHYRRWLRLGEPGEAPPRIQRQKRKPICMESGCDNKHDARGWCKKHYKQYWERGRR